MAPKGGSSAGILDQDIAFSLGRLFDEYNQDDVHLGKRLDKFAKRDLAHVRHYKAAVNIFGGPRSRKRVIVAPPMETPLKHYLGAYHNEKAYPDPPILNSAIIERLSVEKPKTTEEIQAKAEGEKESKYKSWMTERQKLRKNLDGMGLNESYLTNKTEKSELEQRVMYKINATSREKEELKKMCTKPKQTIIKKRLPVVPKIASPAPKALQIMDEHLKSKQIRLLDLFQSIDKDKNWKCTKTELKDAIKMANLPISDKEVEDMIVCLDDDINDELDYSELANGLQVFRRERRQNRRKSNASSILSEFSNSGNYRPYTSSRKDGRYINNQPPSPDEFNSQTPSPLTDNDRISSGKSRPRTQSPGISRPRTQSPGKKDRINSAGSKPRSVADQQDSPRKSPDLIGQDSLKSGSKGSRSNSPLFLEVPVIDTLPGRMMLSSDEAMMDLIKHDKEVLRRNIYRKKHGITAEDEPVPGVIKIGVKSIDDHSCYSTLGGSAAPLVNKFRQQRLEEYKRVVSACKKRGVVLTTKLLDKVLLYPADKAYHMLQESVSQPAEKLITSKFADPPKPVKPSLEVRHKDKIKRSKSGQLMMDTRHVYRKKKQVSQNVTMENLSTGKALVKTKVDTWMTFEEYERLTSNHAVRYRHLNSKSDGNVFWPGQLLHKLCLCMPPYNTTFQPNTEDSLFSSVKATRKTNPGYNNDISWWPVGRKGHIQNGSIEKNYTIV